MENLTKGLKIVIITIFTVLGACASMVCAVIAVSEHLKNKKK